MIVSPELVVVGVRRLRGQPTRFKGPWASRLLADPAPLVAGVQAALADEAWQPRTGWRAFFELRVLDGREVHRFRSGVEQVRDDSPVTDLLRLVWHLDDPALTAVDGLAALCDAIVAADPAVGPRDLVTRLGTQAAGIAPGRAGWADLARAGTNVLPGGGFAAAYDDGSPWQVRHFAGSAAGCLRLGARPTAWASLLRGDLPGSPDHRLTGAAIAFTTALTSGRLAPRDAGDWIRSELAAQPVPPPPGPPARG